jgi:hypothetical protein
MNKCFTAKKLALSLLKRNIIKFQMNDLAIYAISTEYSGRYIEESVGAELCS